MMRRMALAVLPVFLLLAGCVEGPYEASLEPFVLKTFVDVHDDVSVVFRLTNAGDYLVFLIRTTWEDDLDTTVRYDVELFDKGHTMLASTYYAGTREATESVSYMQEINASNVDKVAFFKLHIESPARARERDEYGDEEYGY